MAWVPKFQVATQPQQPSEQAGASCPFYPASFTPTAFSPHSIQTQNPSLATKNLLCKMPCATFLNLSIVQRTTGNENRMKNCNKYLARFGYQLPSNSIQFQVKQAHKANENQTTLTTDRHQFPETRPLFSTSPTSSPA